MAASRSDEEAIFHAARDIPDPDCRRQYVRKACGGDEALIAHVEALLAAAGAPDRLLDRPPVGPAGGDETRAGPAAADAEDGLDFLAPSDRAGSLGRLGHYEVQGVIGRGGMGVVLKAFDESLHRVVAVKVMAPQLAASATARKRFTREARAAAAVSHEHVVTIHAVEETAPLPYIVMQCVAGASLQDRLDQTGPLPLVEILRIGMQTAAGLAAAHKHGLVHRDVKPANILLENGIERVKISDFGLARATDDASLTQSGVIAGTPQYMSPEQAEGKPVDARSDLFSLGSVLYAMCAGQPPFRGSTARAVLKRVCEETPTPVRETNPEVPDWLAAVVENLHAKDPACRFQSAAEVAELLGRHLAHVQHPSVVPLPAAGKPAARLWPSEGRRRWAVAAAALVALVAGLGVTEAIGVTKVRATVIRIFTPDGTLVVETDDPGVKVTIEGDGDLVITGARAQEVRLRPGSYRVQATRDGKAVKLDRDLVTITRGDTQVVRVRLEGAVSRAMLPRAEQGAFVLLGSKGVAERQFDTLAEAVQGASDGDTIEVRGNGPFVSQPITIGKQSLVIRAGEGVRPVLSFSRDGGRAGSNCFGTDGPLVLEGLELRYDGGLEAFGLDRAPPAALMSWNAPLYLANCRIVLRESGVYNPLTALSPPALDLRNCEILGDAESSFAHEGVTYRCPAHGRLAIRNCLRVGRTALDLHYSVLDPQGRGDRSAAQHVRDLPGGHSPGPVDGTEASPSGAGAQGYPCTGVREHLRHETIRPGIQPVVGLRQGQALEARASRRVPCGVVRVAR